MNCEQCGRKLHTPAHTIRPLQEELGVYALSVLALQNRRKGDYGLVHNHGSEEGPGLSCKEHLIEGKLIGECRLRESDQNPNTHETIFGM